MTMKRPVIAEWLLPSLNAVRVNSLSSLMTDNRFVGFVPHGYNENEVDSRHMVKRTFYKTNDVQNEQYWAFRFDHEYWPIEENERGDFFIFDTEQEFIDWLIGNE